MGKKWDYDVPSVEIWKECLRVLKPGGTALIFAGTRTQHRMAVNVEDAGFVLKDTMMWIFGSGFPKAADISKQLDKKGGKSLKWFIDYVIEIAKEKGITKKELTALFPSKTGGMTGWLYNKSSGNQSLTVEQYNKLKNFLKLPFDNLQEAERKIIGTKQSGLGSGKTYAFTDNNKSTDVDITAPSTPEAELWDGWKSHGLKPAYEPIIVAMKPNDGTYAENALKHGVAGLNIDGCRITTDEIIKNHNRCEESAKTKGRYPANIIFDEEAALLLDEQSGNKCGQAGATTGDEPSASKKGDIYGDYSMVKKKSSEPKGLGGASRFFYCCKASKSERNAGCENLEATRHADKNVDDGVGGDNPRNRTNILKKNFHPTVKPLKLMEYLCLLTKTPAGGVVLDPFAGSGTTGLACINTGRGYILIERDEEYCEIIRCRLKKRQLRFDL